MTLTFALAASLSLYDASGRLHTAKEIAGKKAVVYVFTTTDCPVTSSYIPELNRIAAEFGPRGVAFYAVHSDPTHSREHVRKFATEYQLAFPALMDPALSLARSLGATTMPEAAVLDAKGNLAYLGRIDDRVADFGRKRAEPTQHNLRDALNQVLAGGPVTIARAKAVGCAIPFAMTKTIPAKPTFNRDIAPILFENCSGCHRPGEVAPFPLLTYTDARKRAAQIAHVTQSRYMPPWKAESGYGHFRNERRLNEEQIAAINVWAKSGAPEGDPRDLPPPPQFTDGWQAGEPDIVIKMPEQFTVSAGGRDQFQCFVIPLGFDEEKYVGTVEFRPGNRRVVHHALLFLDGSGRARQLDAETPEPGYPCLGGPRVLPTGGLGGWAPGASAVKLPPGTARTVRKGSDLILQIHYHPSGKPEQDLSMIGLHYTSKPIHGLTSAVIGTRRIDIPAGDAAHTVEASLELPGDAAAIGITPHAHYICKDMKVNARLPDGSTKPLIWIKDWDFNWQGQYSYAEPVPLPKGTRIEIEYTYDNSADNPRNPSNPPRRVTFGEQTNDEMAFAFVQLQLDKPEDVPGFQRAMIFNLMKDGAGDLIPRRRPQ
jgi:peroxiredoxin/mono/diheme cytochrome c family protein